MTQFYVLVLIGFYILARRNNKKHTKAMKDFAKDSDEYLKAEKKAKYANIAAYGSVALVIIYSVVWYVTR